MFFTLRVGGNIWREPWRGAPWRGENNRLVTTNISHLLFTPHPSQPTCLQLYVCSFKSFPLGVCPLNTDCLIVITVVNISTNIDEVVTKLRNLNWLPDDARLLSRSEAQQGLQPVSTEESLVGAETETETD